MITPRQRRRTARRTRPARPGARGWHGPARGASTYVQAATEWRATSVQACGLWPFAVGAGTPNVGAPLGRHLTTGATVCADPISWFQEANIIANPSVTVLGLPGLGKSSLLRRMALALAGFGTLPLVLGDLKPDYVDLVEALGGQVIRLGRSRGHLNILDASAAHQAAARLTGRARADLLADALGRRHTMLSALLTIARRSPPSDREDALLDQALRVLDERHPNSSPVLADVLAVLRDAPDQIRQVAIDRGERSRYEDIIEGLLVTLTAMLGRGRLGEMFSASTERPMRRDVPVVFDVSSIDDGEPDLQAAALIACWGVGFGTIEIAHALADAGLEPRRLYFAILDELWRALRAGPKIVDRVDVLTRLNRAKGVGVAMCSHTMRDLLALPTEQDALKARGLVERSGMVICAGLPRAEMPLLTPAVPLSDAEQRLLASWQDPPPWDSVAGREAAPIGRGNFLIKVGGRPGIPIRTTLTPSELHLHDTNKLWHERSRIHRTDDAAPALQEAT